MSSSYKDELALAKTLASSAGVIMQRYFRSRDNGATWKSDNSPVGIADMAINELVINKIQKVFPNHGVLGEEESFNQDAEWLWVCDPLDGTAPYLLGMPNSTFCLALTCKGKVKLSVIYDPFEDSLFHAVQGGGAYVNDQPIHVSTPNNFRNQYVSAYSGMLHGQGDLSSVEMALRKRGAKFLGMPSYSYVSTRVATGEMLASYMTYGAPWDAAAISLIVEEAGGKATDLRGKARDYTKYGQGILVTNGLVHNEIVELLLHADIGN